MAGVDLTNISIASIGSGSSKGKKKIKSSSELGFDLITGITTPPDHEPLLQNHAGQDGVVDRSLQGADKTKLPVSLPPNTFFVFEKCRTPCPCVDNSICYFCCSCQKGEGEPKDVYDSYQSTLQTYLMINTLLMGFIITGAFISVSWAPDATFTQESLVKFVLDCLKAFGYALASFAVSLIFALVAQQVFATNQLASCAVKGLKILAPALLFAEFLMYFCAIWVCKSLQHYLTIVYVTPTDALCTGGQMYQRSDSFCAQLGNDMFDAAMGLEACRHSWVLKGDAQQQMRDARIFNLSLEPNETKLGDNKETAVCNQLDWYAFEHKEEGFAHGQTPKLWFGYMAQPSRTNVGWWTQKAYLKAPKASVYETREDLGSLPLTIIENNGKVLGEAMCGKGKAQTQMIKFCNDTEPRVDEKDDEGNKKLLTYNAAKCATAKSSYLKADDCAGKKFDDVLKCYRTCDWVRKTGEENVEASSKYADVEKKINNLIQWLWVFMVIRLIIFVPWYLFNLLMMAIEYFVELYRALPGDDDDDGDKVLVHFEKQRAPDLGEVNELTVKRLVVNNLDELVGPPVAAPPPLVPTLPPITTRVVEMAPQSSMAKVGVDLNHDGRPDMYYVGADRNHDGVPDALQGGPAPAGLFSSTFGQGTTPSYSYSRMAPTSFTSTPFTS